MALTRSDISGFIINPLSSFHILLFISVISYFVRLMLTPQLSVVTHTLFLIGLSSLWLGSIIAISFIETWVKLLAPTLTHPIGVDVNRHVLSCMNKFELIICITLLHLLEMQWTSPSLQLPYKLPELESLNLCLLSPIVLVAFLQTCWILPALLHRSQSLIASYSVPNITSISSNDNNRISRANTTQPLAVNDSGRSLSFMLYISTDVVKVSCLGYAINLLAKILTNYVQAIARQ